MQDVLIIALLVLVAAAAVIGVIRRMKNGSSCCGSHEPTEARVRGGSRNPKNYSCLLEADIAGMTCENCARRVENALNRLEGVSASVRIDTHRARVLCNDPDEKRIKQAVREAGYTVTGINIVKG